MFVPKKDVKKISEFSVEDLEYLLDLFVAIINKYGLTNYRLLSNGSGKQDVAYLYFYLAAD